MTDSPIESRRCFYVPPGQSHPDRGYVPSIVVENEAGHSPLVGRGELSEPWYWGSDYEEAKRICAKANAETFGLTEAEAAEIVASSIRVSIASDASAARRRSELARKLGRDAPV